MPCTRPSAGGAALDGYPGDRVFVAEAMVNGADRLARYLRPDELHTAFTFDFLHASWDPVELRQVIDATRQALDPLGYLRPGRCRATTRSAT